MIVRYNYNTAIVLWWTKLNPPFIHYVTECVHNDVTKGFLTRKLDTQTHAQSVRLDQFIWLIVSTFLDGDQYWHILPILHSAFPFTLRKDYDSILMRQLRRIWLHKWLIMSWCWYISVIFHAAFPLPLREDYSYIAAVWLQRRLLLHDWGLIAAPEILRHYWSAILSTEHDTASQVK